MNYLLGIRICYLFSYSGFFLDLPRESFNLPRESKSIVRERMNRFVREYLLIHSILNLQLIS